MNLSTRLLLLCLLGTLMSPGGAAARPARFEIHGEALADAVVHSVAVIKKDTLTHALVTCSPWMDEVYGQVVTVADGGGDVSMGPINTAGVDAVFMPRYPYRDRADWIAAPNAGPAAVPPLWQEVSLGAGSWGFSMGRPVGQVVHIAIALFGDVPTSCSAKLDGEPIFTEVLEGPYAGIVDLSSAGRGGISVGTAQGVAIASGSTWKRQRIADGPFVYGMSAGDNGRLVLRVPSPTMGHRTCNTCGQTIVDATSGEVSVTLLHSTAISPRAPFLYFFDLPR